MMRFYHLIIMGVMILATNACKQEKKVRETGSIESSKKILDSCVKDSLGERLYHINPTIFFDVWHKRLDFDSYSMIDIENQGFEKYPIRLESVKDNGAENDKDSLFILEAALGAQHNFFWDGIAITIDPDSRVEFNRHHPNLIRIRGHVYIGLPDSIKSFHVKTGSLTIQLTKSSAATVYNYGDGFESVDLSQGTAQIIMAGNPSPVGLKAGQRLYIDHFIRKCVIVPIDPYSMTCWRQGKLKYWSFEPPRALRLFSKWTGARVRLTDENLLVYGDMNIRRMGCLKGYINTLLDAGYRSKLINDTLIVIDSIRVVNAPNKKKSPFNRKLSFDIANS